MTKNKTVLYYVTEPYYNENSKPSKLWILIIEPTHLFNRALHSKNMASIHKKYIQFILLRRKFNFGK